MWGTRLDKWDEQRAAEDDGNKLTSDMELGADLAFPDSAAPPSLSSMLESVKAHRANSADFYSANGHAYEFKFENGVLSFPSAIITETAANNIVTAQVHLGRSRNNAVVLLPHWNAADGAYGSFARHLVRFGLTVVELNLPYHGSRNRPGAAISDYFLSPNIGRTIRSVRQGVIDTKAVVDWLGQRGYRNIGLIGASLGSCVAGVAAAHDSRICASALLLTAGDFGEVVWTGRATRHIKESLSRSIDLEAAKELWSVISTGTFAQALARKDHKTLIVSGTRDQVVKPYLTNRLVSQLQGVAAACEWRKLSCGHYSMGLFPFSVLTFALVLRFLSRTPLLRSRDLP
jgi:pimeloyl-ACP methyl ester carboxylesterase